MGRNKLPLPSSLRKRGRERLFASQLKMIEIYF